MERSKEVEGKLMRQDLLEAHPVSPPAEAQCLSRAAEGRLARRARSKTFDKQTEQRLFLSAPSGAFHFLLPFPSPSSNQWTHGPGKYDILILHTLEVKSMCSRPIFILLPKKIGTFSAAVGRHGFWQCQCPPLDKEEESWFYGV
ncbi:MAG: hypothetical protein JRI22_05270 [Deltaproteobacteria bacterium]|nr:hypothetical protein [Deltaproteobacteria bacterium]